MRRFFRSLFSVAPIRFSPNRNALKQELDRLLQNKSSHIPSSIPASTSRRILELKQLLFEDERTLKQNNSNLQLSSNYYQGYFCDMLALAAQYLAARDDQHCKEALDILNSGDRHLIEFPDDRMHQLIFLTQISMVSSNYHFYRVNDLQTALREAEKALLLYRELLRDHCPRLNSPTTQHKTNAASDLLKELSAISGFAFNLTCIAHISKMACDFEACLGYLGEKVELYSSATTFLEHSQEILSGSLQIEGTKEEQLRLKLEAVRTLVGHPVALTEYARECLEIQNQQQTFACLNLASQFFGLLTKDKIIEQFDQHVIKNQQLLADATFKFRPEDPGLSTQLRTLQNLLEEAQRKLDKVIFEELNFDYQMLLQRMTGNKLKQLDEILQNIRKLSTPRLFQKEVEYRLAVFQYFLKTGQLNEAWTESQILIDSIRDNQNQLSSPLTYIEVLFESCDLARILKMYPSAIRLVGEIEKRICDKRRSQFSQYLVNYHLLKGKVILDEQVSGLKEVEQIVKGMQELDRALELLEDTKEEGVELRSQVFELKADYYAQLKDKKGSLLHLHKAKTLLEQSGLQNKKELLAKTDERIKKLG